MQWYRGITIMSTKTTGSLGPWHFGVQVLVKLDQARGKERGG